MMLAGQQKLGGVEGAAGATRARQVEGVRAPLHAAAQRRAPHAAVRAPATTENVLNAGNYRMPVAVLVLLYGIGLPGRLQVERSSWYEFAGIMSGERIVCR